MEISKDLAEILRTRMKYHIMNDKSSGTLISVLTGIGKRVEGVYLNSKDGRHSVQFLFDAPKFVPEGYFDSEYMKELKSEVEDDTKVIKLTQGEVKSLVNTLENASSYIKAEEESGDGHEFRHAEVCEEYLECQSSLELLLKKLS
ncbi:hypothetical protein [Vibrio phage Va2]|nr:hypothetical protein [Vibrio phage Va2]